METQTPTSQSVFHSKTPRIKTSLSFVRHVFSPSPSFPFLPPHPCPPSLFPPPLISVAARSPSSASSTIARSPATSSNAPENVRSVASQNLSPNSPPKNHAVSAPYPSSVHPPLLLHHPLLQPLLLPLVSLSRRRPSAPLRSRGQQGAQEEDQRQAIRTRIRCKCLDSSLQRSSREES